MKHPTLYSEIEYEIIMWSNDGTQTAGTLTRKIMELIEKGENLGWECKNSPTGHCYYYQEDGSYDEDSCRYCGHPEERK